MEESAQATQTAEKDLQTSAWRKALRVATYPAALVSGQWTINRDVHQSTYQNLKRYKAFDDILGVGSYKKPDGLVARNEANVQDRVHNRESVETFLEKSHVTKTEYRSKTIERMEHMGLGAEVKNFGKKWNYIDTPGRVDSVLKGATVFGIVAVVLSVANSKPLLELLGLRESKDKEL